MKSHVRALVVGGGAVGASIAYHLGRAGWSDVTLLERDELTSGSTWHAAGLLPLFNMSYATSHIHDHSVKLYKSLEAETGSMPASPWWETCAWHSRAPGWTSTWSMPRPRRPSASPTNGGSLPPRSARWPLLRTGDLVGAIFHPTDGYINPADVTQAMAKGARQRGVEIHRKMQVDSYEWTGSEWIVRGRRMIERGGNLLAGEETFEIRAEHVVAATGNHAQRTARLLGIKYPAIPVEHQFIVTERDPALVEWRKSNSEHPVLRDADAKWYVREERGGWILGPYERGAPARFEYGVPDSFRADLFPLDLERIEEEYMSMIHRIPSAEEVGLKDDFNGPICYTPDGNPLVGPAPGLRNMWLAEGFSFGITAAGGTGNYLAQMMVEGEAEIDMASLDPKRFGSWMTTEYAARKNEEAYDHVFVLHHPDEERPACRPLRTAPCYDRVKERGAQFGCVNGWERPNYYAPQGFDDHDSRSFRRGGWWQYAAEDSQGDARKRRHDRRHRLHQAHGQGSGRHRLSRLAHHQQAAQVGRIALTYALTPEGTTRTEYTIMRKAEQEYYLVSAGAWTDYDADYLRKAAEDRVADLGYIEIQNVTTQMGVFALAGPNSRNLLAKLIRDPDPATALSNKRFPWLSARAIELLMCPATALRVAYTGELGWELHHPIEMQNYLFDRLMEAGEPMGLRLVGTRAQNWLRQEKSYRAFGTELGRDATPLEADLPRFVDLSKDFLGKKALEEIGIRSQCVTLLVDGPQDADPWGREALYSGDTRVGRLTSGGYSVAFGKSIGMGYVKPELSAPGTRLKVRMFDRLWDAEITEDSPYDPTNARIRAGG